MNSANIQKETAHTRSRYDLIAPLYDVMEGVMENLWYRSWRRRFWREIEGERVLEIGMGTGKNLPYHPPEIEVTGTDLSENMLARARKKAASMNYDIALQTMDAQNLDFPTRHLTPWPPHLSSARCRTRCWGCRKRCGSPSRVGGSAFWNICWPGPRHWPGS